MAPQLLRQLSGGTTDVPRTSMPCPGVTPFSPLEIPSERVVWQRSGTATQALTVSGRSKRMARKDVARTAVHRVNGVRIGQVLVSGDFLRIRNVTNV